MARMVALTVLGKSQPWLFSTWETLENAQGFRGCRSPYPAAADFLRRLLTAGLVALACSGGCDVRDEAAGSGAAIGWAPAIFERLAATSSGRGTSFPGSSRLECVEGFAAGSRRAADSGLPLLLIFRASWCRWSDDFVAATMTNTQLVGSADRFVCATVDADREAAICRSFGVRAFPTVIALDPARRERFRDTGAAARQRLPAVMAGLVTNTSPRLAGEPPTLSR
jgi:hypothetical protein